MLADAAASAVLVVVLVMPELWALLPDRLLWSTRPPSSRCLRSSRPAPPR